MKDKLCKKCNQVKPLDCFRPNKTKKDGYQHYCIVCDKALQKAWYENNKFKVIEKSKLSTQKYKDIARKYIVEFLKTKSCVECGESDIRVLEFDHLDNKRMGISNMIIKGFSLQTIKDEIGKCQILCCNCHRKKTITQLNWYDRLSL